MSSEFKNAATVLPKRIKDLLDIVSDSVKEQTFEIRLRKDKPLVLYGIYGSVFIRGNGTASGIDSREAFKVSQDDIQKTVLTICDYSLYAHQYEIANGFVTYGNGNRVGFCGTAVLKNGKISALNNITSINIRISRQFHNSANDLLNLIDNNFKGILLSGPPCSGKTTMLKSIAAKLTSEYIYGYKKCVLIDERYEMCNTNGLNLDILSGYPKAEGITQAVRVLSPEIIICDEIATLQETESIINGMNTGVKFIVSTHANNKEELLHREASLKLLKSGCFDYVVIIKEKPIPCTIDRIYTVKELLNENSRNYSDTVCFSCSNMSEYKKRKYALPTY